MVDNEFIELVKEDIREKTKGTFLDNAEIVEVDSISRNGINNLVKKGFVERYKTERDRRVVKIALTKEGKKIYALHEKFHKDMVFALVKGLNENEMDVVAKALDNLESFVGKRFENGENK